MARLLRRVETLVPRRARDYGGKARSLAALARAGFPVPSAFALPASASEAFYEAVLPEEDRPSSLLRDTFVAPERLEAIAERVRNAPLPYELREGLAEAFRRLREEGAASVAVRSSSTREDQEEASAAGLHETVLDVRDEVALEDAVRRCWASTFAPRVLTYLREVGEGADADAAVGIVVQAMVPAEVAGVLFTVNPLTGDAGEVVINASWGLGAPVVDGTVSPDTIRVDKATAVPRERVIGEKEQRLVVAPSGGTELVPVPEELRSRLSLDGELLAALTRLALRVEEHFDGPRDVEWAIAEGRVLLLQARPVTVAVQPGTRRWQKRRGDEVDRSRLVWSNVNVGEALPGVATPLTWSILSGFSELGFRRALGSLGCTVPRDAELVGSFRGRIYLNLSELLGLLSQVPGLRPKTLLALGGGGE
ncbi:MAG: PEP/pyruvate-binding domain-containing protein, partial [Myxococcota bacterium]